MSLIDDLDDDLVDIFTSDDFNVPAIFTPQNPAGTPENVEVIFNAEFEEADPEGPGSVATDRPNISVNDGAFSAKPKQDDHFLIKGILYSVFQSQPDGTGLLLIFLNEI